jgi:hypothetical protein
MEYTIKLSLRGTREQTFTVFERTKAKLAERMAHHIRRYASIMGIAPSTVDYQVQRSQG